jgi:hypothetical protein
VPSRTPRPRRIAPLRLPLMPASPLDAAAGQCVVPLAGSGATRERPGGRRWLNLDGRNPQVAQTGRSPIPGVPQALQAQRSAPGQPSLTPLRADHGPGTDAHRRQTSCAKPYLHGITRGRQRPGRRGAPGFALPGSRRPRSHTMRSLRDRLRARHNWVICTQTAERSAGAPLTNIRRSAPCTAVTARWLLTVCQQQLGRATRAGRYNLIPGDVPRAAAGDHGHASITACMRRRKRGRSPLVANLSGLRALIWSADAVATATRGPRRTLQHVRARGDDYGTADHRLFRNRIKPPRRQPAKKGKPLGQKDYVGAPWRDRTAYLLLTIYPPADAVANWDDAGQVRGGAPCCRPTYLFIKRPMLGGDPIDAGYRG